ncbi:EAL domain-containing protein [Synechococcus sp. Nb3U1]|uniref:EAL domain-containing protein n=1 Tax=Synechococcus sp. Nb3U1 TaxID=1914529 RepID=UPI002E2162B8
MRSPKQTKAPLKLLATVEVLPGLSTSSQEVAQEVSSSLYELDQLSAMVALGIPLLEFSNSLLQVLQTRIPSVLGALILEDENGSEGGTLNPIPSPHLPPSYQRALRQSLQVSCNNIFWTVYRNGEPIIQMDIPQGEQTWSHWDWAISSGLSTCWVFPIFALDEDGAVVGLLALFSSSKEAPDSENWQLIEEIIQLASVGIQRHRCETQLQRLQESYGQLLNSLPGILWEADGRTLMLNSISESIESLLGYPMQHYLTSHLFWNEAVHPEDRQRVHQARLGVLKGQRNLEATDYRSESLRYRLVSSTGQAILVQEYLTAYRDSSEKSVLRGHVTVLEVAVPLNEMPIVSSEEELFSNSSSPSPNGVRHSSPGSDNNLSLVEQMPLKQKQNSTKIEFINPPELEDDEVLELREAIHRQELKVYYHGILSLDSEKLIGFEALLRWEHPRLGLLSPRQFWRIAEHSGLALEIGWWVLETACQKVLQWQDVFMPSSPLSLCVNLSPLQLEQEDFVQRLTSILDMMHFPANQLMLEITEDTMMMFSKMTQLRLAKLKSKQITFNVDNFGSGFCSLHQLNQLPISALKIDPFFIQELNGDQQSQELIQAIINLAHDLNLQVIAEGVETSEQYACLKELGCKFAQGYLFHQPLPSDLVRHLFVQPSPPPPRKQKRRSRKTA